MRRRHPFFRAPVLAAAMLPMLALTHCGKKEEAAPEAQAKATTAGEASTAFGDKAGLLGGAAILPSDTEFYLGSVQLKKHNEAIKASNWWKNVSALIEDKTPAADTSNSSPEAVESLNTLKQLWGDDFFIAGAAGFSESVGILRDFNRFYNEMNFRALMAGGTAGLQPGMGGGMAAGPLMYLQAILNDPATLERAGLLVKNIEIFPLMIGIKADDAEQKLAKLIPAKAIAELEAKKIKVTDHKTADGHSFKAALIDVSLLIDEEMQKSSLDQLPPDISEESRKMMEKLFADLRSKKMHVAWGVVQGQIIFASGKNLDHLKFAADPASSLLASPAMEKIVPHKDKDLFAISFLNEKSMLALHDDQPIVPMLRGVVSAMKGNAMFGEAGNVLSAQLDELATVEKTAFGHQATDAVGAFWWEKGMQGVSYGGLTPKFLVSGKPLNYAGLLDQDKTLFGITYHGNPQFNMELRAWLEKLFGVVYVGAKELIKAGVAGAQGQQQAAMFDMLILPTFQKVYAADKDIVDKGLGAETAILIDLAGVTPPLPGVAAGEDQPFPRITTVSEVKSRAEVAKGWTTINDTLTGIAAMLGANAGGGAAPGGGAPPSLIPPLESTEKDGFTTWSYQFELLSGDLTPNSTLNDKHLILSTSKGAAEGIAASLAKPVADSVDGCVWKLDLGLVSELVEGVSANTPNQTPEKAAQLKQALQWIKPFKSMQGRVFEKDGVWQNTFEWDISDSVSID
ncbi:hypothetical protein FEM03_12960 [Phragmitibacter flavus]|uniref:DUF3352 domain-containing protein n=2 Tax=Phragmitibacter flavus TaxID=2576071 RepID=A0A5R8KCR3_9BACT|nr:hypothetical protein FEM03_12960 [Phragmitibacter flavus]